MQSPQQISQTIHDFILRQFPLARKRHIDRDTSLLENGIVESLGILEIVTFLESEFNITLSDEELLADHFESINALTTFVQSKVESEKPVSSES